MSYRTLLLNYLRNRDRGRVLALLVAVFAVYLPFLGSPFVFDDLLFIPGNAVSHYAHSFDFQLRWLPYATLAWTKLLFSDIATHVYHLGNIMLHAANTILLFYLLRRLASSISDNADKAAITWGAWFGAMIFALHPVAVYAAGYVVQRSILMATMFAVLTQLAYLRGLLAGEVRWLGLAVLAYFLAVFSKEHSVMTLALLAVQTFLVRDKICVSRRALWSTWIAFAMVGLLIILTAKGVIGTPYEPMSASLFKQEGIKTGAGSTATVYILSVLTQAGLFFKYLLLWILPNPAWMSVDMREPFVSSLGSLRGWLGATGFISYGVLGFLLILKRRWTGLAGLAMLYPWLQFILEFSTIRVQEPFVLYRSYLWMPGIMLLMPLIMIKWPSRKTVLALACVMLLLVPLAVNRLWVFADNYRLWNDAALLLPNDKMPGADRILFNRGQAEEAANRLENAISDFQRVVAISPQYAPVRFELGWLYGMRGRDQEAMKEFNAAIEDDPGFANAYYGKAMLLKMQHKDKEAFKLMSKSCELKNAIACLIVNKHVEH